MIKCPKCGENIQLTWQYCPSCGLNVTQHFKSGTALCDAAKELEEEGKFQEAARLYALAAGHEKKPSAEAMYRLGILYESGPESVRRSEDDIGYCFKSSYCSLERTHCYNTSINKFCSVSILPCITANACTDYSSNK